MRFLAPAALALTAAIATPAEASTVITGDSAGGYYDDSFELDVTAPGEYLVTLVFNAPVSNLYFALELQEFFNEYDLATGDYIGGNDTTYRNAITPAGALSEVSFSFNLEEPFDYIQGDFRYVGGTRIVGGAIDFLSAGPVNYTVTISQLGAAVPEPAAWGLMILGFGAIGAAMRRSRKRVTAAISFA